MIPTARHSFHLQSNILISGLQKALRFKNTECIIVKHNEME